jgi:hypothetical protein
MANKDCEYVKQGAQARELSMKKKGLSIEAWAKKYTTMMQ